MAADSNIPMRDLLAGARRKERALIELTRELVLAESHWSDKAAVNACGRSVAARCQALGGRVRVHRQTDYGDVLEVRFGQPSRSGSAGRLMLLGHLDTVWPTGTLETMPCELKDGRLWGPGTLDMKAGVAMALTALEMLSEANLLRREIVLLLNTDEEHMSRHSRRLIEELARECAAVYVLEPAQGLAYKTARKGTGNWRVEIEGVAAHAGVDFEKGASAVRELARVIEAVSRWTDLKGGVTVNVGWAGGGSEDTNKIPNHAWAEVDVRIKQESDGPRVTRKFAGLKPLDPCCKLTITGGINRPPMKRSPGAARLYRKARALAAELGFALEEASTGGASDGNFTAALGIPTLDGMGAVGEGAHALHESVFVEHLAPRTALLAGMLIS